MHGQQNVKKIKLNVPVLLEFWMSEQEIVAEIVPLHAALAGGFQI